MTAPVRAEPARLRRHVAALEGPRHPRSAATALLRAEAYLAAELGALGLPVERRGFPFDGRQFHNIVAAWGAAGDRAPRVLVGAHFDTAPHTPGADDNASGVAALLETARLLALHPPSGSVELVGFNLEELHGATHHVGSRAFAREARHRGVRYRGALVLEMVGYATDAPGGQRVPAVLRWKQVPRTGTFLAAAGDWRSGSLLRAFARAASRAAPDLPVVTLRSPLRGWLLPYVRLSDNASFWDQGFPALLLTDTAFLRNPHYHRPTDRLETLNLEFLARVTDAVAAAVRDLSTDDGSTRFS